FQSEVGTTIAGLLGSNALLISLLSDDRLHVRVRRGLQLQDELARLDVDGLKPYPFTEDLKSLADMAHVHQWWKTNDVLKDYVSTHGLVPVLVALHGTFLKGNPESEADLVEFVKGYRDERGEPKIRHRIVTQTGGGSRLDFPVI